MKKTNATPKKENATPKKPRSNENTVFLEGKANGEPVARSKVYKVTFKRPLFYAETYNPETDEFGRVPIINARNITEVRNTCEACMRGDMKWPYADEPTGYVIDSGDKVATVYYIPRADFIKFGREESRTGDRGRTVKQTVITGKFAGHTQDETVPGVYATREAVYAEFGRKYGYVVDVAPVEGKRYMCEDEVARYARPLKSEDKAVEDITAPDDMDGNAPTSTD